MNSNRLSTINREPTNGFSREPALDSGRGSMPDSERTSSLDGKLSTGAASSLSRGTPLDGDDDDDIHERSHDEPIRISRTPVLGHKCYQQAFVSHIDHPSAFFIQLAHFHKQFEDLHKEINEYYSKNSRTNPSPSWKRGDYCIAKFNKDNQFYRARIIEVPAKNKLFNLYDVVYLDYGNWTKVALTDIHVLLPKFARLTAQAVPCSLTKTLPNNGNWLDHPEAMELFEKLVLNEYVDATFHPKTKREFWPLTFVDLVVSSSKLNVREQMRDFIRNVSNEEIYEEFNHLLGPQDYIIYSISHEGEDYYDDN